MHVPRSPVKFSATLVTACNYQRTVTVVFKLWTLPCHSCPLTRDGNVLVRRTVDNHGAGIVCEKKKNKVVSNNQKSFPSS